MKDSQSRLLLMNRCVSIALVSISLFVGDCSMSDAQQTLSNVGDRSTRSTYARKIWHNLAIIFPHNGAQLTYNKSPADLLVEISLESASSIPDKSYLPRPLSIEDAKIGELTLTISLDGSRLGSVRVGSQAGSSDNEGTTSKQCNAHSNQLIETYREIDKLREAAYSEFRLQEFGSPASARLFAQWTTLAEELADLEEVMNREKCEGAEDKAHHQSQAAEDGDRVRVSVIGLRRAAVWPDDQCLHARDKLWVSLSIHGITPGHHFISVSHELADVTEESHNISIEVLNTEQLEQLQDGTAPLIGLTAEESFKLPRNFRAISNDDDWGRELNNESYITRAKKFNPASESSEPMFSTMTICVLTGFPVGARESLRNSMRTWVETGLLSSVNETIIFIQNIHPNDFLAIPAELDTLAHDLFLDPIRARIIGSAGNIGIGRAIGRLLDVTTTQHILFLEDDWILPFSRPIWEPVLTAALSLLNQRRADVVRLKSDEESPQFESHLADGLHYVLNCGRFAPPHATHFFCACLDKQMQEYAMEGWGGQPVHEAFHDIEICWRPPSEGPEMLTRDGAEILFYCMPSRICKYTNTPSLFTRDWFAQRLAPVANVDPGIGFSKHYLEETLNISWPLRDTIVAVPNSGLFAHMELSDKGSQ